MDDFFEDQSAQGSIFPVLSVLCCVIGTMVLILIAGSLNAAGIIAPEMSNQIDRATEELSGLESEISDLSRIKSGTKAAKDDLGRVKELLDLNVTCNTVIILFPMFVV